jgi:tetratricopeptide (TPR) repeat protein
LPKAAPGAVLERGNAATIFAIGKGGAVLNSLLIFWLASAGAAAPSPLPVTVAIHCNSLPRTLTVAPGVEYRAQVLRQGLQAKQPAMLYIDERGVDVSLQRVDALPPDPQHASAQQGASGQALIRSDAAPSRAARERMWLPSHLQVDTTTFHMAPTGKPGSVQISLRCAPPDAVEAAMFQAANALADSEALPDSSARLRARAKSIATFESVLTGKSTANQRAQALHNLGFLYRREGRLDAASTAYIGAQALWQAADVPMAVANAIVERIQVDAQRQQFDAALALIQREAVRVNAIDATFGARIANDQCFLLKRTGASADVALACYQRAEVQAKRANDLRAAGGALLNQTAEMQTLGRQREALLSLNRILRQYVNFISPQTHARTLMALASMELGAAQLQAAVAHLEQASSIAQQSSMIEMQADVLRMLSFVYLELSDSERAMRLIVRCLALVSSEQFPMQYRLAMLQQARIQGRLGQYAAADTSLRLAQAPIGTSPDKLFDAQWLEERTVLALDQAQLPKAYALLQAMPPSRSKDVLQIESDLRAGKSPQQSGWEKLLNQVSVSQRVRVLTLLAARQDQVSRQIAAQQFQDLLVVANQLNDPVVLAAWLAAFDVFAERWIASVAQWDSTQAMQAALDWSAAGYVRSLPDQRLQESAYRQLFQTALGTAVPMPLMQSSPQLPKHTAPPAAQIRQEFCDANVAILQSSDRPEDAIVLVQTKNGVASDHLIGAMGVLRAAEKILADPDAAATVWRAQLQLISARLVQPMLAQGITPAMRVCFIHPFAASGFPWAIVPVPVPASAPAQPNDAPGAVLGTQLWLERNTLANAIGRVRSAPMFGDGPLRMISTQSVAAAQLSGGLPAQAQEWQAISRAFGKRASMIDGVRSLSDWQRLTAKPMALLHVSSHGVHDARPGESGFTALANQPVALSYFELSRSANDAPIVVLSACYSAQVETGRGALLNPASAFLRNGAQVVIATAMEVPDAQAAQLFAHFYAELSTSKDPVAAFRTAQRAVLNSPHIRDARAIAGVQVWISAGQR